MTAPVVVTPDTASTMQFIMPTAFKSVRYALTSPPTSKRFRPWDSQVTLHEDVAATSSARSTAVFSAPSDVVGFAGSVGVVDVFCLLFFVVVVDDVDGVVAVFA